MRVFRVGELGLGKLLGPLEAAFMDFLWNASGPLTAREVYEGTNTKVKYITVVTVLNNLTKKTLLRRRLKGRAHLFEPLNDREEFVASASMGIARGLVDLSPRIAVNSFVGVLDALSREEIESLQAELARYIREQDE